MKKLVLNIMMLCLGAIATTANAGVSYDMQNGKMAGASGISIGGELYSVTFGDSCSSMYAGCNSALFDFKTEATAVAAIDALFNQVFLNNVKVNGTTYNFDSNPELVKSCDRIGFCEIWVPYKALANNQVQSAWKINADTYNGTMYSAYQADYTYGNNTDYMAFTNFEKIVVAADVPEPASLALFGLGVAGLIASRKKKSR